MKTKLRIGIPTIILCALFFSETLLAQQQQATLQQLLSGSKNIFLLVSAEQLYQDAGGSQPVDVTNYCAIQDNAGNIKYGDVAKERDSASSVNRGDEITWSGKVDPASRDKYTISLLQVVVREVYNQNIFDSTYLPGKNHKVVADVLQEVKEGTEVRYDIWFMLEERATANTKTFVLDPWIIVR